MPGVCVLLHFGFALRVGPRVRLRGSGLRLLPGGRLRQGATGRFKEGSSQKEATASSAPQNEPSAHIDPALIQRVSRELALHIGPIAAIVVKRAAPGAHSIEDFYLKVAEEIESSLDRQRFLARIRD